MDGQEDGPTQQGLKLCVREQIQNGIVNLKKNV